MKMNLNSLLPTVSFYSGFFLMSLVILMDSLPCIKKEQDCSTMLILLANLAPQEIENRQHLFDQILLS